MHGSRRATAPHAQRRALTVTATLAALGLVFLGGAARAERNGVKVGEGRLHPFVETESHHVQNPGYQSEDPAQDVCMLVRPGARLEFPKREIEFSAAGEMEYRRYLGIDVGGTTKLSAFGGKVNGELIANRDGTVTFRTHESFARLADAGNQSVTTQLLHVTNDAGLALDLRPGGGALVLTTAYSLYYDRYDRDNPTANARLLDNLQHRPMVVATWKFLPRTALFVEADGNLTTYPSDGEFESATSPGAPSGSNQDIAILTAYFGAVGSVTPKIAALIKAGYGETFKSEPDRYRSVVGQAEITYTPIDSAKLRAGILRTVEPTSLYKYFGLMRAYIEYEQAFFTQTAVRLNVSYSDLRYGTPVAEVMNGINRTDGHFNGEFSVEHRVQDWLSFSFVERLNYRDSDYDAPSGKASYFNNDFFVRAGFTY